MTENTEKLLELLKAEISKLPKEKIGIAFSGGIDSSLTAKIMKDSGINFRGYVAGVKNSHDIIQAKKVAEEIGFELVTIELNEKEIEEAIPIQDKILREVYSEYPSELLKSNAIPISFNLPLYFVAKYAEEKIIIVSQGPDEMLGGYTRHQKLNEKEAEKEMKTDTENLLKFGIMQNIATGKHFKKEFIMPYLSKDIVNFCLSLNYNEKINNNTRKLILRKLGEKIGLKSETAFKEKKAAQYGSGIIYVMKKLAKRKNIHISKYIREREI
ncbi:hypothetical protein HYW76_04595 [Candidatus Pacearchaeota archaeon]|nr:hypothetical protein [Candidatus Pacearchaeota archaeon]